MHHYREPVVDQRQPTPAGFLALIITTPAYLVSIICWFVLVWLTLLDLEGTPARLSLGATLVTHTYPVTVLGAVAAGWLGFFTERPRLMRFAPVAPPLHALLILLVLRSLF